MFALVGKANKLSFNHSEPAATNAPIGRFVRWMGCIFSFDTKWGSLQSISFCCWPLYFFFLVLGYFSFGLGLTHSYPTHLPTFISIAPTLLPYLLSPIDIAIVIISYLIDLITILTTYPTNLATLLITYPANLTTILTTYPIDLATLHT